MQASVLTSQAAQPRTAHGVDAARIEAASLPMSDTWFSQAALMHEQIRLLANGLLRLRACLCVFIRCGPRTGVGHTAECILNGAARIIDNPNPGGVRGRAGLRTLKM